MSEIKGLISIVIPVYNGADYIKNTINSLQQQTYKNFEVIIVDDCSTDNSVELISNVIQKDPRFKLYIQEQNQGNAVKNVEWTIPKLKGEWFFYMSHDDLIDNDFFEKCMNKINETNSDCVLPNMLYYYPYTQKEHLKGTFPPNFDYSTEYTRAEAFLFSMTWKIHAFHLKRMSIVRNLPWNSHLLAGDEILNRLYFFNCNKICYVNTNFYYNIANAEGITRKVKPALLQYVECYFILTKFCKEHDKELGKKAYNSWLKYTIKLLKQYTILMETNYLNFTQEEKVEINNYLKTLRKEINNFILQTKNFNYLFKVNIYSKIRKSKIKVAKNLLVIFADIPTKDNEQKEIIQRELAIDDLFTNFDRIYVEKVVNEIDFLKYPNRFLNSYFKNISKNNLSDKLLNSKVKVLKVIRKNKLNSLMQKANKIYIHSLLHLEKIPTELIEKYAYKIVLDIYEFVPEKLLKSNQSHNFIARLEQLEFYYRRIRALVSVSYQMTEFYRQKYPAITTEFINLPIFYKDNINNGLLIKIKEKGEKRLLSIMNEISL